MMLFFKRRRPPCKKNNRGRIHYTPEVKAAADAMAWEIKKAMSIVGWEMEKGTVTLELGWLEEDDTVEATLKKAPQIFQRPIKRRFDIQNLADIYCDAFQKSGAILNDKQIVRITIREYPPAP